MIGKIVDEVVNQTHVVVGISTGKFYPVTNEDFFEGEKNTKPQGNGKE